MGCDITMHTQVKNRDRWVWYDKDIYSDRNYVLFGILCGCRGTAFKPIAGYKGYPEDSFDKLKPQVAWDYDDVTESGVWLGYAGISWLSLTELRSFDWTQTIPPEHTYSLKDITFTTKILPYLEAVAERFGGPDNVRIVFGFSV